MSLPLPPVYFINWVNQQEVRRVFDYNRDTHVWAPTESAAGRVEIQLDGLDKIFVIDDEYAMFVDNDGTVSCGFLTDKVYARDYPRLEFYRQVDSVPRLIGSIGKSGILSVISVTETDTAPSGTDRIYINDKVSIGVDGLICANVNEITLLASEDGKYIISEDGLLIMI